MKNSLMSIADKILLRKRAMIETVNDELKNIAQIEHSRHRSFSNFIANSLQLSQHTAFLKRSPPLMSSCSMTGNCLFSNFISNSRYRNLFEHETFDWFAFNDSIISKHLTGKRKAIAIDPSYIPKSGKKTPWIGYFWSGCAGEYKRGLEIMGIGVIDIDNHECMTLGSIQTPDCKTLDNMDKNLVDWYSSYLISRKDKIQSISR